MKPKKIKENLEQGHVIHTLMAEHDRILGFLEELSRINQTLQMVGSWDKSKKESKELLDIAKHLIEAESHHQREEEVLFPELEKRDILGPPEMMRMEHKELRSKKKELFKLAQSRNKTNFNIKRLDKVVNFIISMLREHIYKENNILYPMALEVIKEKSIWDKMKTECDKIGYCCFTPQVK